MGEPMASESIRAHIKPLEELTLMDDYMFGVVMSDKDNLKPLIERILGIEVRELRFVQAQRSEKEGYASHGIRLDLYVVDGEGRVFNVEVQTSSKGNLPKRMRYYQSVIDVDVLAPGVDYRDLRRSVVLFICNYDPFGQDRRVYRFENLCTVDPSLVFGDGTQKVVANTKGTTGSTDAKLMELLGYLDGGEPTGEYTRRLAQAVKNVKSSEERRHEYMVTAIRDMEIREEGRMEGRMEGREENRLESIRSVMESLDVEALKAMEILRIPQSDWQSYAEQL